MNPWQKEFLNLEVGDWIVWQDIPIETADGTVLVIPGMKGKGHFTPRWFSHGYGGRFCPSQGSG